MRPWLAAFPIAVAHCTTPHHGPPVADATTMLAGDGAPSDGYDSADSSASTVDAVDDGPIDPPRPIAPSGTSTVTSRLPTLRWQLAAGTDGARVELCHERACTTVLETLDVAGEQARPTHTLPVGPVFWRVRGRRGGALGVVPSPTWTFDVGAHDTHVDTAWGTTPDVDGDGRPDLAIGLGDRFVVYTRRPITSAASPDFISDASGLLGPDGFAIDGGLVSAGDVDGDGYGDLAVVRHAGDASWLEVYGGSGEGLVAVPQRVPSGEASTGPTHASVRFHFTGLLVSEDFDRDGYSDLVASVSNLDSGASRVLAGFFRGGPHGLSAVPAVLFTRHADSPDTIYGNIHPAGDVNGDGYPDLLVCDGGLDHPWNLYLGGAGGLGAEPSAVLPGWFTNGPFGAAGADVDGDGYADLMIAQADRAGGSDAHERVEVYRGGPAGPGAAPDFAVPSPDPPGVAFGSTIAALGDVDGDGFADVALTSDGWSDATDHPPLVRVYHGAPVAMDLAQAATLVGPLYATVLLARGPGDLDGDGFCDVAIGLPAWTELPASIHPGEVRVFAGAASGVSTTPWLRLGSPFTSPGNAGFPSALALGGSCERRF